MKFYGIIATSTVKNEEYTQKLKNGKEVTKTRKVVVPSERVVTSSYSDRLGARKELESFARKCNGTVKYIGAFKQALRYL